MKLMKLIWGGFSSFRAISGITWKKKPVVKENKSKHPPAKPGGYSEEINTDELVSAPIPTATKGLYRAS
jgi:hypothetical protein